MTKYERDKWVVDNIRFIHTVCKQWRKFNNYDDIFQTACLATLEALSRVDDDANDKMIRSYVARYIYGYVVKYVINTCLVFIPHHERGKTELSILSTDYEYTDSESTFTIDELFLQNTDSGFEEAEVMTDFTASLKRLSKKKQEVALLLAQGYTQYEVADIMDNTHQYINLINREVKQSYRKYMAS